MTDAASSNKTSRRKHKPSASKPRSKRLPADKLREARRVAVDLFRKRPDWISFHRALYGVGGEIVRLFPTAAERDAFAQTGLYGEIDAMEEELRRKRIPPKEADPEPTRIITVRLPRSVHEALREEASSRNTSINKLCIAKLISVIEASPDE